MKLGEVIKEFRKKNDMSQRQFASICGVSNGYVSMLEEGRNPKTNEPIVPSLATLRKLSSAMGMTVNELMTLADEESVSLDVESTINLQLFGQDTSSDKGDLTESETALLQVFDQLTEDEQRQVVDFSKYLLTKRQAQKTVRVYRAARSTDHHDAEIVEMDAERLDKLKKAPETDDL